MSDDLIKREDAIKALNREKSDWNCDYNVPIDNCIKRLKKVKSADRPHSDDWEKYSDKLWKIAYERGKADRPQGEWKPKNHHTDYCSNCGFEETQWRTVDYNFCPSCGARMKGVDDEHTI